MKATIRYTKYEGYRVGDEGIVRVAEITHCIPLHANCSLIMLTNGKSIPTADALDELERRIDAAELREEDADA